MLRYKPTYLDIQMQRGAPELELEISGGPKRGCKGLFCWLCSQVLKASLVVGREGQGISWSTQVCGSVIWGPPQVSLRFGERGPHREPSGKNCLAPHAFYCSGLVL